MSLRRLRRLPVLLALLLLTVTVLATAASLRDERDQADRRGAAQVERAADVIRLGMTVAAESLDDMAGLFDASQNVNRNEFSAFGSRVLGRRGLSSVAWIERVPASGRARYERVAGHGIVEPAAAGFRRAAERSVYFPVTYWTSVSDTRRLLGFDEGSEPARLAALLAAVATGAATATPPVSLTGSGRRGILLFQPVFRGGGTPAVRAARQRLLAGFVVGAYRIDALMQTASAQIDPGLPLELRDGRRPLSAPAPGAETGAEATILVGGRRWTVLVGAPETSLRLPITFLASGVGLTLLALALALVLARRDRFALEAVMRATEELRTARRSQRALVENSPDVVARWGPDLRCLYANAAIERTTGIAPDAFVGRTLFEAGLPADIQPAWEAAVRSVFETGEEADLDVDFPGPSGTVATHSRLAPERGPGGDVESVLVVSRDVTAQRVAETALRAGQERYRSLVAAMSDGVLLQDAAGTVVACNPAAERILGLSADQLMGRAPIDPRWRTVREDGTPLPADEGPVMATRRTGLAERDVTMGVRKADGSLAWLTVSTEPIEGGGVVSCFSDITGRRDTEKEQAALRRIATLVAAGAEPARAFERIAEEAAGIVGAGSAALIRFDQDHTLGTTLGAWAEAGGAQPAQEQTSPLTRDTAAGIVAETGRAARIAHEAERLSAVAAPILVDGTLWGALAAAATRSRPLPAGAEDRLTRLAELAALAILSATARDELATLAATDSLTGLWNRRAFEERLAAEIERARRHDRPLSLVVLDIDHFKMINDVHGHPAGDRVLVELARRLLSAAREGEIVARIGGEEFAWILPETDAEGAAEAAERTRLAIATDPVPDNWRVTVSLGVCDLEDAPDAAEVVRMADRALYRAKSEGRNRVARHRLDDAPFPRR